MNKKKIAAALMSTFMVIGSAGCGAGAEPTTQAATEASTEAAASETDTEAPSTESTVTDAAGSEEVKLTGTGAAKPEDFIGGGDDADEYAISDGDVLIDLNFDNNDTAGFGEYMNEGEFTTKAKDGKLVLDIKKCGSVDYANQSYYDGFSLSKGCVYTYSFDITSDIERKVEYRIQLNGGDYHAYVGDYIEVGPDEQNISVDFEMTDDSDPAPRLCFNMGKMDNMDEDPGAHTVTVDNVKLVVKDASNAETMSSLPGYVPVAVNQVGYKPADKKIVVVKSDSSDDESFIICDLSTNETVYTGKLGDKITDPGAGIDVRQGDFSDFAEAGDYYIVTAEGASYPFKVSEDPYKDIYKEAVLMLYRQRCGMAVEGDAAGYAAHAECHLKDAVVYGNEDITKDVTGGWHDAGDYGRYVVSGAEAVADLMMAYRDYDIKDDDLGIPESGNGIPDILDEARYELDWMLKMQDDETGGVYHKVTGLAFPDTVPPEEETATMYLMPISTTATGDFAAVMAMASVIYKDIDPEFAESAYSAAEKAWDYVKDTEDTKGYKNPSDVSTGEYPDSNTNDEKYWAAAELYLAGRDDLEDTVKAFIKDEKIVGGLGWIDMGTYADYDLARSDKAVAEDAKAELIKDADEAVGKMAEAGYFTSMGDNYPWGSNMTAANQSQMLQMAYNVSGDAKYKEYAALQLDYLFGTNAMGYCFVTGFGTYSPKNPHHRPSQITDGVISGMLVGGPNGGLEDPYAQTVLEGQSPAMCYIDSSQSYATNEVAIYWNSPLIYAIAAER